MSAAVILGKMYSNSMMVMLNSRAAILDGRSVPEAMALSYTDNKVNEDGSSASRSMPSTAKSQGSRYANMKTHKSGFMVNVNVRRI